MTVFSRKKVMSQAGGDPTLTTRVINLENNEYKVLYFETISATTGTITKPTNSTILLDQFYSGGDAIVETLSNGQPTGQSPLTVGGAIVSVSSFDLSGNFVLSDTPSAFDVALIYLFKIKAVDYANVNLAYELGMEDTSVVSQTITNGVTTKAPSEDVVFDALAGKADTNPATDYPTPLDADKIGIWDVANSLFKFVTWANIKATSKTYFDTIYQTLANIRTSWQVTPDDTHYPSEKLVKDSLDAKKNYIETSFILGGTLNPADSTTYYFSNRAIVATTTPSNHDITMPYGGTIVGVNVILGGNTASGTSESSTLLFRNVTQATSSTLASFQTNGSSAQVINSAATGLNINFLNTDRICLQINSPVFAVNPTGIVLLVNLTIEITN